MKDIKFILGCFYEAISIPIHVATIGSNSFFSFPESDTPFLSELYIQYAIKEFGSRGRDESHPFILVTGQAYYTGIAKLDNDKYLIVGPISQFPHERIKILELCSNVIRPEKLLEFCDILATTPLMSYRKFCTSLILAIYLCNGNQISHDDIILFQSDIIVPEFEIDKQLFENRELFSFHSPQIFEVGILESVETGDLISLKKRMSSPISGDVGRMSSNLIMQERYTFVSFATLLTRAAIKGGLNYELACSMSDVYCRKMDSALCVQDISALGTQMAIDFCTRVAESQGKKKYSFAVKTCCEYIVDYLHNDIKLMDLADITGLDVKVISRKFYKETGLKIREYINRERMKEAKYLLLHTNQSIADIGAYLKYSSQSYFTKVFREICGCTPQDYRNSNS